MATKKKVNQRKIEGSKQSREFSMDRAAVDSEARTVEIAFSSEEPYSRWFGTEVLSHESKSVRLDRLNGGGAVLVNHDTGDQVGVVTSARIDDDGVGRCLIKFSRSKRGKEIQQDVEDDIRQLVSVGYRIHKYEVTENDSGPDDVRVTDWEPYEVSIVAVPADKTVGVGRSDETNEEIEETIQMTEEEKRALEAAKAAAAKPAAPEAPNVGAIQKAAREEEKLRTSTIRAMAERHDLEELGTKYIEENLSAEDFNKEALEKIGERNQKARADSEHDGEVDVENKDRKKFSLVKLMDALANSNDRSAQKRAGLELEISAEAQRGFGADFNCRGEFVPTSFLEGSRALSVGGAAGEGQELVANDLLAGSYIEVLRNASALMNAGMRTLPGLTGTVDIPRQTQASTATWLTAEDVDATESQPAFDQVSMAPKDLACYSQVTRRLLMQSTPAIEGLVRNDLAIAQALGIDRAGVYGSGAAGQPLGLVNQAGINTVNKVGAGPTYAELIQAIGSVMSDNALMGSLRWLIEANGWISMKTTPKQGTGVEGNFILGDSESIAGYPYTNSNQLLDDDQIFGDFSQLMMGEWGGLEMNVDPYTQSLKGRILYITFKTIDIAVRQPSGFCLVRV